MLRILELFTHEVGIFLKKQATFYHILLFQYVCKQTFHISPVRLSRKLCYNVTHSAYSFYVKTKISVDFHISISCTIYICMISAKIILKDVQRSKLPKSGSLSPSLPKSCVSCEVKLQTNKLKITLGNLGNLMSHRNQTMPLLTQKHQEKR